MRLPVLAAALALVACGTPPGEDAAVNESVELGTPPQNESLADVDVGTLAGNAMAPGDNSVSGPVGKDGSRPFQPLPEDDECKASEYQWLVGQPRSKIPDTPDGVRWRVACTDCPITMDFSPARMNIFYDEKTDIIKEVKCG